MLLLTDKPHNPMINAGAIVVSSLLKKDLNVADRFDYVSQKFLISFAISFGRSFHMAHTEFFHSR